MNAATRQTSVLLKADGEIVADNVKEEVGVPYYCPQNVVIATIKIMLFDQTLTLEILQR
jgi:hypothetical protein